MMSDKVARGSNHKCSQSSVQCETAEQAEVGLGFLPVGGAVGSRAAVTHRGSRTQHSQRGRHRAVIPPDEARRRRAARPSSELMVQQHSVLHLPPA
uniref:Uncharacterized protein n=1 Tax=Knipowitschia caucasica TaxID=637954 RepID=A0AAV2JA18_KNICA